MDGRAELFGTELAPKVDYEFIGGTKGAIFTWHGCTLVVTGKMGVSYVASETPMVSYLNAHLIIEQLREKGGCRAIIVGSSDSGKTSLARILGSYAVKRERRIVLVDLDPNEGTVCVPTSIGAMVVDKTDAEETTGFSTVSTPPLLYYFGDTSPGTNVKVFNRIVSKMAAVVERKLEQDAELSEGGLLIDTHPWNENFGFETTMNAIEAFQVNLVITVGSERLHSEFQSKLKTHSRKIEVIKLPKSGGVVSREVSYRKQMQMRLVREYFYGSPKRELAPYTSSVSYGEIAVRRIGENNAPPTSALPLGSTRKQDELQILKVEGSALLHSILFLSNSELPLNATDDDDAKRRIHLLCPNPGKLPKRFLWMGTLRWAEV
jgi:polyribonucleotide 5'-hydroxyl-kinase